jgi:excisionase family DNA binding protein
MTPTEAAEYLKVSVHALAKWRQKGTGPGYTRTGNRIKYPKKALDGYLKKNVVTGERKTPGTSQKKVS